MKDYNQEAILGAIEAELGVNEGQITSHSRKRKLVFARFIYAHNRRKSCSDVEKIASEVHRDRNTIDYYLVKYAIDFENYAKFRRYAEAVERRLSGDKV